MYCEKMYDGINPVQIGVSLCIRTIYIPHVYQRDLGSTRTDAKTRSKNRHPSHEIKKS